MASKEDDRRLPGEMNGDEPLSASPLAAEERLETERVLGAFAPRAPRLNRERLLALVQDVRQPATSATAAVQLRTPWYWPAATAVMTATSLALAVLLALRVSAEPTVRVESRDRIVQQQPSIDRATNVDAELQKTNQSVATLRPRAPQEYTPPSPQVAASSGMGLTAHPEENYLHDRRVAIEQGIDALAMSRPVVQSSRISPPATQRELMQQFVPLAALRPTLSSPNLIGWPTQQ
jgi:hypothetical protein